MEYLYLIYSIEIVIRESIGLIELKGNFESDVM